MSEEVLGWCEERIRSLSPQCEWVKAQSKTNLWDWKCWPSKLNYVSYPWVIYLKAVFESKKQTTQQLQDRHYDTCFKYTDHFEIPNSLDLCGSVGWAPSHKLKGHWLDSQSGHMPRLQVQSPVGAGMRGNRLIFPSHIKVSLPLSLSLPHSLKINK